MAVRFLSPVFFVGFIWLALLTFAEYFGRSRWLAVAAALLLFWPASVAYPGWINDDVPMYFLAALVLWLLVRWNKTERRRHLEYGLVLSLLSMTVKGTGVVLIGAAGLIALDALWRRRIGFRALLHWPIPAAAACMLATYFGRIAYYRYGRNADVKWFLNLDLSQVPDWPVESTPYDFLYFSVQQFIHEPFFSRTQPLFWNAFLKTLLFSEWAWTSPLLASAISGLLLVMLVYVAWYWFTRLNAAALRPLLPPLAMTACMVGAMMAARVNVPAAYQCNARYVAAITVPLVLFFVKALQDCRCRHRPLAFVVGGVVAAGFVACSILMIVFEQLSILSSLP